MDIDLIQLHLWYEDHNDPTYIWYYDITGAIKFDITDLVTNGNITNYDDIMQIEYGILWQLNTTESSVGDIDLLEILTLTFRTIDFDGNPNYRIDWVDMSDGVDSFAWNTTVITYDTHTDLTTYDYTNRFSFSICGWSINSTVPHAYDFMIDESFVNITYENHHLPVYNWTYQIDGYVEWDLSDLITNGNSTELADFERVSMTWIWQTNISVDTTWYTYNFQTSAWIYYGTYNETTFVTNASTLTKYYINPTTYVARLRFVTNNTIFNSSVSTGSIQLDIDLAQLNVAYENHLLPLYRVSHMQILLYRWDISELYDEYNVTAKGNFNQLNFTFRWYANYSININWKVWKWGSDYQTWHTETQTSWGTDSVIIPITIPNLNYVPTQSQKYIYLQSYVQYVEHNISYSQINRTHLYVDYMKLGMSYDNRWDQYLDWNVSAQIIWDYTTALSGDFDWDWVYDVDMEYMYWFDTNSTIDIFNISFYYNITETTLFHDIAYNTSTLVSNLSQSIYYANNTNIYNVRFIMDINASITHELFINPQIVGYAVGYNEFLLNFELINCTINFLNQSEPYWGWSGVREAIYVVPYDYGTSIIEDTIYPTGSGTLADPYIYQGFNVTDQYGNYLQGYTTFPDFDNFITANYTPPQTRVNLVSYADQRGEYLDFLEYKTRVDGTLIYDPYFYREVNDIIVISTYDRFDNWICNTSHTVKREDNWIPINITLYSFKIYNQQESFMYFNLTENPATDYYWSEYLAPNEITEFRLISGNYSIDVTTYENNETINNSYDYELTEDNFLLVDSKYNLLLLSDLYHESVFSNLTNWSNVYDDLSQIALYEITNAFHERSIKVVFRYEGDEDAIIIGAGETVKQILPLNATSYVYYRVYDLETNKKLEGYDSWQNLPTKTRILVIGKPETDDPLTPTNIRNNGFLVWGLMGLLLIFIIAFVTISYHIRKTIDPKQQTNRERYDTKRFKTIKPKGKKHRSGIINFKETSS